MEIEELKRLAGISGNVGYKPYVVDENPSKTAAARKKQEKEMGLKPGDKDWFKLWFSLPFMMDMPKGFRGRK